MFIPIGDYPNPVGTPWVTRALIALNAAIFLFVSAPLSSRGLTVEDLQDSAIQQSIDEMWKAQGQEGAVSRDFVRNISRYDLFVFEHGYKPGAPSLFDLLLCMFLHGGLMHLIGNMLFLWIYGDNVEMRLGPVAYLAAYLLTGIAATLAFAVMAGDSLVPLVGASGAISGMLGFYLVWYPHNRVKVFMFLGWFFMDVIHIKAVWVLLFYLVVDNLLPLLSGAESAVAYGAHLGGFAAGAGGAVLLGKFFPVPEFQPDESPRARAWQQRFGRDERHYGHRFESQAQPLESPVQSFRLALDRGDMRAAARAFSHLRVSQRSAEGVAEADVFRFGDWLFRNDTSKNSYTVFRYYLTHFPTGANLHHVHLGLGIILGRDMKKAAAAREHLLMAIDVSPSGSPIPEAARQVMARLGIQ